VCDHPFRLYAGIPLTKLVESEADKLLGLADELHKRIIGQDEAVVAVAEAIQRSRCVACICVCSRGSGDWGSAACGDHIGGGGCQPAQRVRREQCIFR
jgi:hypothetical protein